MIEALLSDQDGTLAEAEREALAVAKKAARGNSTRRCGAFGCAGMASRIRPLPLEAMVQRHR